MEKPTNIFLSSTWEDLQEHRVAILHALSSLKREVESMEYWAPSSDTPLKRSISKVFSSSVFIGILGMKYGSIGIDGKSITQSEYECAYENKKIILFYLIDEQKHLVLPKYVDIGDNAYKLRKFKETVISRHTIKNFHSQYDLASSIVIDLIKVFDDLGKNVKMALKQFQENRQIQFLLDIGYSMGYDEILSVDISSNFEFFKDGVLRASDPKFEAVMAAAFLAQNIKNGNFNILRNFITLRSEVLHLLLILLKQDPPNSKDFAKFMKECTDIFLLRILTILAGHLGYDHCADSICNRLIGFSHKSQIFTPYRYVISPFNDVAKRSLNSMSEKIIPVLENYIELSKKHRAWQAKKIFEAVLKSKLKSKNSH